MSLTDDRDRSAIGTFARCTNEELELLAATARPLDVRPGTVVVDEKHRAPELVLVIEGVAEVSQPGRPRTVVGRGDVVGRFADAENGAASVTALTPMRLGVLGPREVATLVSRVSAIRRSIIRATARRGTAID